MNVGTRLKVGAGLAAGLLAGALAVVPASADVSLHMQIPTGYPIYNSCTGELVDLTGNVDWLETTTLDSSGGIHVGVQTNFAGVSGVGETTGLKYQGTGHGGSVLELRPPFPVTFTNQSYQQMISQGPSPNLVFSFQSHQTMDANGTVTATFDRFSPTPCH